MLKYCMLNKLAHRCKKSIGQIVLFLSYLIILRFTNGPCQGGGNQNGTCYTEQECSSKGGNNGGSCASGFGVCCISMQFFLELANDVMVYWSYVIQSLCLAEPPRQKTAPTLTPAVWRTSLTDVAWLRYVHALTTYVRYLMGVVDVIMVVGKHYFVGDSVKARLQHLHDHWSQRWHEHSCQEKGTEHWCYQGNW